MTKLPLIKFPRSRLIRPFALAVFACVVAIAASTLFSFAQPLWTQTQALELNLTANGKVWFTRHPLVTDMQDLFDLGVVDVNNDDSLDIFTSNHSQEQFLLLGEGGRFSDNQFANLGLSQDPEFPGLEGAGTVPELEAPGLYIYWWGRDLVLQNYRTEDIGTVTGKIELSAPIREQQNRRFSVEVQEQQLSPDVVGSTVEFTATGDRGKFVFTPYNVSLPITFTLNEQLPLDRVYVGNHKIHPQEHTFTLYVRDRHGMAWADYDDSGKLDVFIVRGGLRARMEQLPERYTDELLIQDTDPGYTNHIEELDIDKEGCPALQTAWADYNNDNLLDIYTVCFKPNAATQFRPNQLYRQEPDQTFTDVAAAVNLDIPEGGTFAWLDVERDGDLDLFWVNSEAFWLYTNQSGQFEPQQIGANPGEVSENFSNDYKLTLSDYDNDGDLDLFFASTDGNALLVNQEGTFQRVEPPLVGLPTIARTANWVDYDNDGLTDLHALPGGLYRQQQDHSFVQTHLLEKESETAVDPHFATWFDANNDGSRDLLMASGYQESEVKQLQRKIARKFFGQELKTIGSRLTLYSNVGATNHWLEVKLVGSPGNRQAIGSHVEVVTSDGVQLQTVGQAEGSHYSQGHYRLYFGLGQQQTVEAVRVYWSDGSSQEIQDVVGDRLLTLKKGA